MSRSAKCHPDQPNRGHGLCKKCYYQANRAKIIQRAKLDYANRTEERKQAIYAAYLKRTFGITVQDYAILFAKQHGVCALCGKPPCAGRFKRLHVDHDHKTGKVRGLLCRGCNGLVGWYEHHQDILKQYLSQS